MEKTVQRALIMVVLIGLLLSACEGRRKPKEKDPSRRRGCPDDLVYNSCGACEVLTCGKPMPRCNRMCYPGCFCPVGQRLISEGGSLCTKQCPDALDANIAE
ncbi:cysteine-rich venom protein 6 [Strongylocentrotus purpuratus]|uniref:TIL domain-containing protein n=1 Tax=Strongylocentrotus purpuratus TaxID=7668 RepID=A0A7M7TGM8_STRPU|nr:cysteine-rich venom protein 6 [Strongylocentrotus purpuratus]|eukprot:XP_785232.2 PREDICTED: cysteine-rich venom protein 6-like [Strongylocentrotus purpuratus]